MAAHGTGGSGISAVDPSSAQGRYEMLATERNVFLSRAGDAAALTIPSMFPRGTGGDNILSLGSSGLSAQPFQSIGARGVNNLSAKLLLALFPPGASFFRLTIEEKVWQELKANAGDQDIVQEVEEALRQVEKGITTRMDHKGARRSMYQTLRHLMVAGNALLYIGPKGDFKMHRLDSYVVKRDLTGEPIEIIFREGLSPLNLPEKVRAIISHVNPDLLKAKAGTEQMGKNAGSTLEVIWLYTRLWLDKRTWRLIQEVQGMEIPGTRSTFPKDKPAYFPLRWQVLDGEDYGRGFVEEYMGDLRSLEAISQSIIEFAAAASKILFMVDEGGITRKQDLQDAISGDIVDGDAKDVTILMMEKFADFQVVSVVGDKVEKRMEEAFLLNKSVTRQAERVTAEEIRFVAGELEQALGGVYATLAQEMQRPMVVRLMALMAKSGDLPSLPDEAIAPQIVTGLEGLGRSSDLSKLDVLLLGLGQAFGPDAIAEYVSPGDYLRRRALALGMDVETMIRSEDEVQAIRQAKVQAETLNRIGPAAITATQKQAEATMKQSAADQAQQQQQQ